MDAVNGGEAVTGRAFAALIGKSPAYVSKLKTQGRITARSFTADGRIIPSLALEDMAAGADPARRGASSVQLPLTEDATFAQARTRKTQAEAERVELELKARKGELVERGAVAATWGPYIRELRDAVLCAPRDTVLDPVQAADCEAAISAALETFAGRLAGYAAEVTHAAEAAA